MIHVLKMSGKYYAADISHLDEEEMIERISQFASEGTPSIILGELADIDELELDVELGEIEIVEIED